MLTIQKTLWNISIAVISIYIAKITPETIAKFLFIILVVYNVYRFRPKITQLWNRICLDIFQS